MSFYEFEGRRPEAADSALVYPEATVMGSVAVGEGCYVGAGAVFGGDWGDIAVGPG